MNIKLLELDKDSNTAVFSINEHLVNIFFYENGEYDYEESDHLSEDEFEQMENYLCKNIEHILMSEYETE